MNLRINFNNLVVQVIVGIILGVLFGIVLPEYSEAVKILSDIFIRLISLLVGPIIFCTIVAGITGHGDIKAAGKIAVAAIIYFEVITTFALFLGLWSSNLLHPGVGIDTSNLDISQVAHYINKNNTMTAYDHILNIFPESIFEAFANNNLLQILFFSVFFGIALASTGNKSRQIRSIIDDISQLMFKLLHWVVNFAPMASFGAMAYTVSKFGTGVLVNYFSLIFSVYFTMFLFVAFVLGAVCYFSGFSLWSLLVFLKEEITITIGTSSSETVLPQLMEKLELFGCSKEVVGLVVPTGYSFNLDGTSIYLSAAVVFIAQAYQIDLSFTQEMIIIAILMLNSKGAAAVTGGGFITLAATLSAINILPLEGLVLLLGVDRFMSGARALTNMIGNSVAAVVISKWEAKYH